MVVDKQRIMQQIRSTLGSGTEKRKTSLLSKSEMGHRYPSENKGNEGSESTYVRKSIPNVQLFNGIVVM